MSSIKSIGHLVHLEKSELKQLDTLLNISNSLQNDLHSRQTQMNEIANADADTQRASHSNLRKAHSTLVEKNKGLVEDYKQLQINFTKVEKDRNKCRNEDIPNARKAEGKACDRRVKEIDDHVLSLDQQLRDCNMTVEHHWPWV